MNTSKSSFSSFLFSLLFLLLFTLSSSQSSNDAQHLITFKNTLYNPNLLPNWQRSSNPCSFSGVSCSGAAAVTAVDLSDIELSSDVKTVVASLITPLASLKSLSLKSTNLTGSFADLSPFRCSSGFTQLDFSGNGVSGSVLDLSVLTSSCSGLKILNMSRNILDYSAGGSGAAAGLDLESIDLSFNRISGQSVVQWLVSGGCGSLKHLSLKANMIAGKIPVSGCESLEYFDLSLNNYTGELPAFGDCRALQHLDLSNNRFFGSVGDGLLKCTELLFLNISFNNFSGALPSITSGKIQFAYLSNNTFEGEIPAWLVDSCSTLVEVDLSANLLTGMVPRAFSTCSGLELFNISSNAFYGELPFDTFMKMSSLKNLVLSYNKFVGYLPNSLSNLTNLETLDLSSNNISGPIPPGLCDDPSLKELYLQDNLLTGTIPDSLSNCSQLVVLDLSFNYLKGTIPPSLGSLSQLKSLIIWLNQLHGEIPEDIMYIKPLENLILDYNKLTGSIPSAIGNATNLIWISLSNNRLTGLIPSSIGQLPKLSILNLGSNLLYGAVPPQLGDCPSLVWLDLNSNMLNGSIPGELAKQSNKIAVGVMGKRYAYVRNIGSKDCHGAGTLVEFAGIRDDQLARILETSPCGLSRVYKGRTQPTFNHNGSLIFLDISYNSLEGSIPKELGLMYYLMVLNLAHNSLSGEIPVELGGMKSVGILDLSENRLVGSIPNSFAALSLLTYIDVSNNNLSGVIPTGGQMELLPASAFVNNSGLCGIPLSPCVDPTPTPGTPHPSHRARASLAGSGAMGLLFSLFCIFGLVIVVVEAKKRRKKETALDVCIENHSHSGNVNSSWKLTGAREAWSINLSTFEEPLRNLTLADLLEATNGFHNDTLIGSGGFGDVYRAQLKDGSIVAIKKLIHISGQGDREFTAEMETIGKIKHRNLVPLLGYCKVGEERLLVYEYMRFGSLEDILHDRRKAGIKLNWSARRKIAIGSARGLDFLHHKCTPRIIHRDMKSSNVLLDENLEARVSDFGMARMMSAMDTHLSVSTLAGTPGYVPPEYYQSFRCSMKGDVYSYGVVLLELLTGRQPTDSADFGDNNLVGWVKQHRKLKISDVFDPELLKEDPTLELELLEHLKVACACLDDRPKRRPTMNHVMMMLKEIQAGSGLDSSSTIAHDDGVEVVEMSISEGHEPTTD